MAAQGGAGSQPKSKLVYQYSSKLDRNTAPTAGGPSSDGKVRKPPARFRFPHTAIIMQFAARRIVSSRQARDAQKGKLTTRCVFSCRRTAPSSTESTIHLQVKIESNKRTPPCFLHCPSLAKNHDGLPTQARDRRKATRRRFNSKKMFGHFPFSQLFLYICPEPVLAK